MAKMRKFIIEDTHHVPPFNQPARELTILNKPLWLAQRDALAEYCGVEKSIKALSEVEDDPEEMIVHSDSLYFDEEYIKEFVRLARARGVACRAAFAPGDDAFTTYCVPLSRNIRAVP